jgi:peptidoglycan/xylan/chitin deacetylase (PgdA/CDA1 family)
MCAATADGEPQPRVQGWHPDSWEQTFGTTSKTELLDRWPKDKRLAVLLCFDTQADIDANRPGYQTTVRKDGSPNYVDQMERQYEAKAGLKRILRILRENGVKATFPTTGMTAEWYPELIGAIAADGHEVASHSYSHWLMNSFTREEEREEIEKTTDAIAAATGERPVGWRSPLYSSTGQTLELLAEAGYRWDASFPNDDLPYWIATAGGPMLALPSCLDDSNMYLMANSPFATHAGGHFYASPPQVLASWQCEFDVLYEESLQEPRICSITMHPRVSGRPFRSWALSRLIEHALGHDGVFFPTCSELAALCGEPGAPS